MSGASAQGAGPPALPGYRFLRHIGAGGNAQVYLYEQELPSRKVAVKVLNESALSADARRRFTTEANVTAVLAHRHIVQVFEAKVTDDGRPYIVMPFYPQPNLSVRARRAHFSVAEVLRIGIQIGSAVETSHRYDVLHRDIKPQNILTDSYGEPALTDFGIATTKPGDGPEGLSLPWSPPEILDGTEPGDHRSDVYSLGATLWHLLVGRSPFEYPGGGTTTGELIYRISSEPPPPTGRADVPNSFERLLRQAMAKDPAARPQSAMELIRGLQSVEQELRLPLTHPILPADQPDRADSRGRDTIARPAVNAGEPALGREPDPTVTSALPPDRGQPPGPVEGTAESANANVGPVGAGARPAAAGTASDPRTATVPEKTPATGRYQRQATARTGSQTGSVRSAEPAPDQPTWGGDTQDLTILRGGRRPDLGQVAADASRDAGDAPGVPADASAADADGGQAAALGAERHGRRRRTRLDPLSAAATLPAVDGAVTPARVPILLDPSGGAASPSPAAQGPNLLHPPARRSGAHTGRLPAAPADAATVAASDGDRGTELFARDQDVAAGQGKSSRGRALALAGGGALLAVVAAVIVLDLSHGTASQPSGLTGPGPATQSASQGGAPGADAGTPGQPSVTVRRVSAGEVEFRWTYTDPAPGDTFQWREVPGPAGVAIKPYLLRVVAKNKSVCITVSVRRTGGQASLPSGKVCSPK